MSEFVDDYIECNFSPIAALASPFENTPAYSHDLYLPENWENNKDRVGKKYHKTLKRGSHGSLVLNGNKLSTIEGALSIATRLSESPFLTSIEAIAYNTSLDRKKREPFFRTALDHSSPENLGRQAANLLPGLLSFAHHQRLSAGFTEIYSRPDCDALNSAALLNIQRGILVPPMHVKDRQTLYSIPDTGATSLNITYRGRIRNFIGPSVVSLSHRVVSQRPKDLNQQEYYDSLAELYVHDYLLGLLAYTNAIMIALPGNRDETSLTFRSFTSLPHTNKIFTTFDDRQLFVFSRSLDATELVDILRNSGMQRYIKMVNLVWSDAFDSFNRETKNSEDRISLANKLKANRLNATINDIWTLLPHGCSPARLEEYKDYVKSYSLMPQIIDL